MNKHGTRHKLGRPNRAPWGETPVSKERAKRPPRQAERQLSPRAATLKSLRAVQEQCDAFAKVMDEHGTFRAIASIVKTLGDALEVTFDDLGWLLIASNAVQDVARARAHARVAAKRAPRGGR
jgi:hypothetical protein